MFFSGPTYLFLIFVFIVALAIGGIIAKNKTARSTVDNERQSTTLFLEKLLQSLNCQFSHDTKDKWQEYTFKYQNGNFIAICKSDDSLIRFHYPHFLSTSIENINIIREISNECNTHNFGHHVVYTINGEANKVDLHIISSIQLTNDLFRSKKITTDILDHCFTIAQEFYLRLERNKDRFRDLRTFDVEKAYAVYERELFLMRELEIRHQEDIGKAEVTDEKYTISNLLETFYSLKDPEFLELKVITHELKTIVNEKEISSYNIGKVLVTHDCNQNLSFTGNTATLILTLNADRNDSERTPLQIDFALKSEGKYKDILYQRVTISSPPLHARQRNAILEKKDAPHYVSFLFACSDNNVAFRNDEFKKSEARISQSGQDNVLKQDERFALDFNTLNYEKYVEYGRVLFREKRFYEACIELESVFRHANCHFYEMNSKGKDNFYDLCFYLGLSYSALGLYKEAYYYLDIIFSLNNFPYMEAYINCIVDAKDFRAVAIIDNIISQIKNTYHEANESLPDETNRFFNFLLRRKGHFLIDMGQIEDARKIFEALYNDPESQDYALNELAFIQKKYGKERQE